MDCDICATASKNVICAACSHATLYPLRLEHARLLLDKERVGKQVKRLVESSEPGRPQHEHTLAEIERSKETVSTVVRKSEELKSKIETYRAGINQRKAVLQRRQRDKDGELADLRQTRDTSTDPMKRHARKALRHYENHTSELIYSRAWLCHAAASIVGLRRVTPAPIPPSRPQSAHEQPQETYQIAGLTIPSLRDLNTVQPKHITAVLDSIVRLLHIACVYLAIQLPAEMVPPDLNASSSSILPSTSSTSKSRPRPLHLKQQLPQLTQEHPSEAALFLEGVTLLAWDIAWLSRTQGIDISTWEDVCDIGRNLHNLFITAAGRQTAEARKSSSTRRKDSKTTSMAAAGEKICADSTNHFGRHSHNTAFGFIPGISSTTISAFTPTSTTPESGKPPAALLDPQIVRDALQKHLLADMQGAEWEVLEEGEYTVEPEEVVLVGKGRKREVVRRERGGGHNESGLSLRDGVEGGKEDELDIMARTAYADGDERKKDSANGWMKVRGRGGDE